MGWRFIHPGFARVEDRHLAAENVFQQMQAFARRQVDRKPHRFNHAHLHLVFEAEPSKRLARALGLEHYDWLSYDYVASDFYESPEDHSDVTEVT